MCNSPDFAPISTPPLHSDKSTNYHRHTQSVRQLVDPSIRIIWAFPLDLSPKTGDSVNDVSAKGGGEKHYYNIQPASGPRLFFSNGLLQLSPIPYLVLSISRHGSISPYNIITDRSIHKKKYPRYIQFDLSIHNGLPVPHHPTRTSRARAQ